MVTSRKSNKPPKSSALRIIGGQHRGRKLPIPDLEGLRPTSDRVRETLFNWLQFDLADAQVLDLFAGTGALGLEALSRGARNVVFVEPQIAAVNAIKQSLNTLHQENAVVYSSTSEQFLNASEQAFDLVFIDPPFALNLWQPTLQALSQGSWLSESAMVYVECPKSHSLDIPMTFDILKEKTAGQVRFQLLQKNNRSNLNSLCSFTGA